MSLTSLSIMLTVFVLHLHHARPSRLRRVPSWMRQLFILRVGPALRVRRRGVGRCRPSPTALTRAMSPSAWPSRRRTNSVDPEVATTAGYLPLAVRPVRGSTVEHADDQRAKQPERESFRRDDPVTRHLTIYLERRRAEQQLQDVIAEWRLVAKIFDRLLFWIFLVGTAASTAFILIILPLTKPDVQ